MADTVKTTFAFIIFGLMAVLVCSAAPYQDEAEGVPVVESSFDSKLHQLWGQYLAARDSGDEQASQKVFEDLESWKQQSGAEIFELAGYLFLEQGQNYMARGDINMARQEFINAAEMNPYLWPAYDGLARIKRQEGRYQQYFNLGLKGVTRALKARNSYFVLDAMLWFLLNLAWVVVLGFAFVCIAMSLKYLRPLYHTTMGFFEHHEVSPLYGTLLSLILLLLPLILGVNLLLIGAVVVALFYPFFESRERKVALSLFVVAMILPLLDLGMIRLNEVRSDQLLRSHLAQFFDGVDQRLIRLAGNPGEGESKNQTNLIMGLLYAAAGDDMEALTSYEEVSRQSSFWPMAQVNIGNIRFDKQKEYQQAIDVYNGALEADPGQGEALYNLHVVYSSLGKLEDADRFRTRAFAADASLAERARVAAPGTVLVARPDYETRFTEALLTPPASLGRQLAAPGFWGPIVGLVLLFGIALAHAGGRNDSLLGRICIKCGRVYFQSDSHSDEWCGQCMSLYVNKEDLPSEAKNLKFEQVKAFARKKRIIGIISQILLPGAMKLTRGKPSGGAFTIFVWMFLIVFCLFPLHNISHPMMNYLHGPGLLSWIWYLVTAVFWVTFGLRPIWQEE